jgi:hypothetical protein
MNDLNVTDKLKDIKPSQIIQIDFTPYIYIAIAIALIGFILILIFVLKNKKRKRLTKEEQAKKNLKSIDFKGNTKDIVYSFTVNGYDCLDEKNKNEFMSIVKKLEPYKYKKDVKKLSDDLIDDMKDYIRVRV